MKKLLNILKSIGLPYAYDHFEVGENIKPPFVIYRLPSSNNFAADGVCFYAKSKVDIEVYTDKKDLKIEDKVEKILTSFDIFYNKDETYVASEKFYEVIYSFELAIESEV